MYNILPVIEESTANLHTVCHSDGLHATKTILDGIDMRWCMHKDAKEFDQHVADLERLCTTLDEFKMSHRLQLLHPFDTVLEDVKVPTPLKP